MTVNCKSAVSTLKQMQGKIDADNAYRCKEAVAALKELGILIRHMRVRAEING